MAKTDNDDIEYFYLSEYHEDYGPDGASVTALLQTAWADKEDFPYAMLGLNEADRASPTGIHRLEPQQHPTKDSMFCTRLRLLGSSGAVGQNFDNSGIDFFDPANTAQPTYARWEATFAGLPYQTAEDDGGQTNELYRYVQVLPEFNSEFLQNPGNTWQFQSPIQKKLAEPIVLPFPTVHLIIRWWWVPYYSINYGALGAAQNTVNSDIFFVRGFTATAGTLLFNGFPFGNMIYDADGNPCQHIDMSFIYRPTGWNNFFRNDIAGVGPGFDAVMDAQTGKQTPFKYTKMGDLFKGLT